MKEFIYTFFGEYRTLIIFLHVISAVVWVGGMIALRYAAHYSFIALEDPALRLTRVAHALKRLFLIVAPFIAILLITAVLMAVGLGFRAAAVDADGHIIDQAAFDLYQLVHVKEGIWTLMTINFVMMVLRRNSAQKLLEAGDLSGAKGKLGLIGRYMVPVNIALGLIAIFLGVTLRHAY